MSHPSKREGIKGNLCVGSLKNIEERSPKAPLRIKKRGNAGRGRVRPKMPPKRTSALPIF